MKLNDVIVSCELFQCKLKIWRPHQVQGVLWLTLLYAICAYTLYALRTYQNIPWTLSPNLWDKVESIFFISLWRCVYFRLCITLHTSLFYTSKLVIGWLVMRSHTLCLRTILFYLFTIYIVKLLNKGLSVMYKFMNSM